MSDEVDNRCPDCNRLVGHGANCKYFRPVLPRMDEQDELLLSPRFEEEFPLSVSPNPKQAYGDRKVPGALVPPAAVVYMGEAFAEGARKYGPYNWREKAVESMTYLNAIWRHWAAYLDGEEIDPESGAPHLALLMASAAIIVDCAEQGNLIDTRPIPGKAAQMLRDRMKPAA